MASMFYRMSWTHEEKVRKCTHSLTVSMHSLLLSNYREKCKNCRRSTFWIEYMFHFSLEVMFEAFFAPINI
jgi:hypothetical protein